VPNFNRQPQPPTPPPASGVARNRQQTVTPTSSHSPSREVDSSQTPSGEAQQPPDIVQPPANPSSPGAIFGELGPYSTSFQGDLNFDLDTFFSGELQGSAAGIPGISSDLNLPFHAPTSPPTALPFSPSPHVQEGSASLKFLRRDNERLSSSSALLQDEVRALRQKYGAKQAQVTKARDQLQPLHDLLQNLLYLPDARQGATESLMDGLFAAMKQVSNMQRTLMECEEG